MVRTSGKPRKCSQKCSLDRNTLSVLPESNVDPLKNFLVLSLVLVAFACLGQKESTRAAQSVAGVVYVTGNEPFTFLSLQTDDGVMHKIQKDTTELYRSLRKLQGQRVRLRLRAQAVGSDSLAMNVEQYEIVKDH
jgi:hypothetical protein